MGKATITSGGTDGNYTIAVQYDTTEHKATIAKLDQQLGIISTQISALSPRISAAETELDNAQQALDDAIDSKDQAAMQSAIDVMQTKQGALNALTTEKHVLTLQQKALEKQKEFLNDNVREERSQSAWCADFTEDLTGNVGTIDCGRIDGTVIIKPGFDSAAYTSADGQLQDVLAMSPAGAYYNYAMITGVAKWLPLYRTGTASAVDKDSDTMSVSLDPINIAGLGCDQGLALSGVAVNYMNCNAEAFEDGDGVVVEFGGNFGAPTVIGFSANPQECGCEELTLEGTDEPEVGSEYTATGGKGDLTFGFDKGWISITSETAATKTEPRTVVATITDIFPCENSGDDRTGVVSVTDECENPEPQSVEIKVLLPGGVWVCDGYVYCLTGAHAESNTENEWIAQNAACGVSGEGSTDYQCTVDAERTCRLAEWIDGDLRKYTEFTCNASTMSSQCRADDACCAHAEECFAGITWSPSGITGLILPDGQDDVKLRIYDRLRVLGRQYFKWVCR